MADNSELQTFLGAKSGPSSDLTSVCFLTCEMRMMTHTLGVVTKVSSIKSVKSALSAWHVVRALLILSTVSYHYY